MFRLISAVLLLAVAALPAGAQDNPIAARMTAFVEAYNAGDAEAIAGFYAPNGVLLPPQAAAVVGREAIAKHYAAAFGAGVGNLRVEIKEIRGHGPGTAVAVGQTLVDQGERSIRGRYLHVWLLSDAGWMLSRDIYHVLAIQ